MKKTIIYIIIVLMLGSIFASAIPFRERNNKNEIVLLCVDKEASNQLLELSAEIISNRLNSVGIDNAAIEISKDEAAIGISFNDKVELENVGWLLSSKGELGFYETANRNKVIEMLQNEDELKQLLNITANCHHSSDVVFGCCSRSDMTKVTDLIHAVNNQNLKDAKIQFAWGASANEDNYWELFLLKGSAAIDGSKVDKAQLVENESMNSSFVLLDFDKIGAKEFHDLSERNISNSIAIVLDNVVYASPIVHQAISGGKCIISGKFVKNELTQLVAIINNGELPLDFQIAK